MLQRPSVCELALLRHSFRRTPLPPPRRELDLYLRVQIPKDVVTYRVTFSVSHSRCCSGVLLCISLMAFEQSVFVLCESLGPHTIHGFEVDSRRIKWLSCPSEREKTCNRSMCRRIRPAPRMEVPIAPEGPSAVLGRPDDLFYSSLY